MRTEYFQKFRKIVIVTLSTLLLILLLSNINAFLNQRIIGTIIVILSFILFMETIVIANRLYYILITIPNEYLDSDRYLIFTKDYSELDRKEIFNYFIYLEIKQKLGINTYFLENYPEHIYFEHKEIAYCINTKDYGGTILENMDSSVWDIGYGSGKYNRYVKKIPIPNPFYENKRIIEQNYNFKNKKMVSIIIISRKTKMKQKITGVYEISDFLKEFSHNK